MLGSFWIEYSIITVISRSSIFHLAKWISPSIFINTSKRCSMKLSFIKEANSFEWVPLIIRILVWNERESIGYSLEESAYLKSHFDLIHVLYCCFLIILFVRMDNSVFIVLFELQIFLLESIEVVVEVKAGEIILWLLKCMTLFDFFLIKFIIGGN